MIWMDLRWCKKFFSWFQNYKKIRIADQESQKKSQSGEREKNSQGPDMEVAKWKKEISFRYAENKKDKYFKKEFFPVSFHQ